MQRLKAVIKGRVQGVFFRSHARDWASGLGLTGIVRNLSNGDVEVIAEGPRERLEAFLERLREGPPSSRVIECFVEWGKATKEFKDFRVIYQ